MKKLLFSLSIFASCTFQNSKKLHITSSKLSLFSIPILMLQDASSQYPNYTDTNIIYNAPRTTYAKGTIIDDSSTLNSIASIEDNAIYNIISESGSVFIKEDEYGSTLNMIKIEQSGILSACEYLNPDHNNYYFGYSADSYDVNTIHTGIITDSFNITEFYHIENANKHICKYIINDKISGDFILAVEDNNNTRFGIISKHGNLTQTYLTQIDNTHNIYLNYISQPSTNTIITLGQYTDKLDNYKKIYISEQNYHNQSQEIQQVSISNSNLHIKSISEYPIGNFFINTNLDNYNYVDNNNLIISLSQNHSLDFAKIISSDTHIVDIKNIQKTNENTYAGYGIASTESSNDQYLFLYDIDQYFTEINSNTILKIENTDNIKYSYSNEIHKISYLEGNELYTYSTENEINDCYNFTNIDLEIQDVSDILSITDIIAHNMTIDEVTYTSESANYAPYTNFDTHYYCKAIDLFNNITDITTAMPKNESTFWENYIVFTITLSVSFCIVCTALLLSLGIDYYKKKYQQQKNFAMESINNIDQTESYNQNHNYEESENIISYNTTKNEQVYGNPDIIKVFPEIIINGNYEEKENFTHKQLKSIDNLSTKVNLDEVDSYQGPGIRLDLSALQNSNKYKKNGNLSTPDSHKKRFSWNPIKLFNNNYKFTKPKDKTPINKKEDSPSVSLTPDPENSIR